ncbi:MAG: Flp family type IVb pilin [Pseudomonadota bacterium]
MIRRFLSDDRGTTAIEYALLATIITVGIITALTTMGTSIIGIFGDVSAGFTGGSAS